MPSEFKHERRIEFHETDMAGIVHFSNYFRFMEACEHAFVQSLGLTLHSEDGDTMLGWPRVHAECDYSRPLRYMDLVEVHLSVREKTRKQIVYDFVFRVEGEGEVARGALRVVSVARGPGDERMRAVDMPAELFERIEVAAEGKH